jgi:hypothetical protein
MTATISKALLRALTSGRKTAVRRELSALLGDIEADVAAGGDGGSQPLTPFAVKNPSGDTVLEVADDGTVTIASTGETTVVADAYGDLIVTNPVDDGSTAQCSVSDGLTRYARIDSRSGVITGDDDGYANLNKQFLSFAPSTDGEVDLFGQAGLLISYDNTAGAAKVRISGIDSNGATVTAEIPLSA